MKIGRLLKSYSLRFRKDLATFKRQMEGVERPIPLGKLYPILNDAKDESGI